MQFSKEASTILIVDDNKDNLDLLSGILTQEEYQVRRAINGTLALKTAAILPPSLVLLDVNMPDMSGYEVCREMKQNPKTADIPIIFISALNDVEDKLKAFSMGGVDYITKPFKMSEVLARVETHLALATAKREVIVLNQALEKRVEERTLELEQRALELEFQSQQLQDMNQNLKQEIVQRQKVEEQLLHVAYHDSLTNLPNRASLLQALEQCLAALPAADPSAKSLVAQDSPSQPNFAVIYLDCDRFKVINDCLGHDLGDQILLAIAERLQNRLPETALLYRQGGDEFTILLQEIEAQAEVERLVQSLAHCFEQPFLLQQHELFLTASFGILLGHGGCGTPENILRDVDTAMYHAKANSNLPWQFFDQAMHQRLKARLELENEIRRAIEHRDFSPVYQPIIDLKTGLIAGFETLIRWHHKTRGFISPGEFIPVAEEAGLIIPIDLWVLQEACRQTRAWQTQFFGEDAFLPHADPAARPVPWKVSVNLSVKQFSQPNLLVEIDRILAETGLSGQSLKLEITETAIMDNADSVLRLLRALKQRGIQLAIDDFGTGYSSLSYLHRFPVDTLKIDQLFVSGLDPEFSRSGKPRGAEDFEHNLRIVRSAVNLAHELDMDVVAEGIETPVMQKQLMALGCDYAQGYLLGRPLSAEMLEARLNEQYAPVAIAS